MFHKCKSFICLSWDKILPELKKRWKLPGQSQKYLNKLKTHWIAIVQKLYLVFKSLFCIALVFDTLEIETRVQYDNMIKNQSKWSRQMNLKKTFHLIISPAMLPLKTSLSLSSIIFILSFDKLGSGWDPQER